MAQVEAAMRRAFKAEGDGEDGAEEEDGGEPSRGASS
jgi:hypothetical protein